MSCDSNIKRAEQKSAFSMFSLEAFAVLDNISEHVVIHDTNMRMVWANRAAAESVGLDKSELAGKSCYKVWHDSTDPCPKCPVLRAMNDGVPQQEEVSTPDGRTWDIRSYPIKDDDGVIIGAVELTLDITLRKKAEINLKESEESYRSLYESSQIGWWRTRIEDGMFLKANPAAVKALGFEHESQLIGQYSAAEFYSPEDRKKLLQLLNKNGVVDSFETRFTFKNGVEKIVLLSARIYPPKGIIEGNVTDITEHKRAIEALRDAMQRHSELYNNLRDGIASVNTSGRIIECNAAFANMLGYSTEEAFKLTYEDITPEKWHAVEKDIIEKQVMKRGYSDNYEKEYRRKDGSIFPVELQTYLSYDKIGEPSGLWAFVRDITARKRSEVTRSVLMKIAEATISTSSLEDYLKIVHEQVGRLIYAANFYVALYDPETEKYSFPYLVDEIDTDTDVPPQIINKSLTNYVRQSGIPLFVDEKIRDELERNGTATMIGQDAKYWLGTPLITPQGSIGVVAVHSYSDEHKFTSEDLEFLSLISGHVAMAIERKSAGDKLRDSQQMLQLVLDSIPVRVFWKDRDLKFIGCNKLFARDAGLETPDDIIGKTDYDLAWKKEQADSYRRYDTEVINSDESQFKILESQDQADGREAWLETNKIPLHDSDGNVVGLLGSYEDITERLRAEKLLKESERKYRGLVETISDGLGIFDFDEKALFVNTAACKIFGYRREELIGMDLLEIVVPEDIEKIKSETRKRKTGLKSAYEFSIKRKDGEIRNLRVAVTPYRNPDGNIEGAIGLFSDITEKAKLEEQLERAQRMESLGVLAGGVAHDLNNILGPLVAYPEMILMKLPPDSPARRQIEMLGKSARDAADVIQDLLTLARRGRYEMKPTDLNEVIESYLASGGMAELKSRNPNVHTEFKPDREAGKISGSTPHLLKVIMNLIVNAFDAMSGGGRLTVETGREYLGKLHNGYADIKKGDYVIIKVTDTGIGIPDENLNHIFEPYYSKKEMGSSGSGLGLAVVYGIVKDHKGYYDIDSTVGEGTQFTLYFPLCNDVERIVSEKDEAYGGHETVLVVDDVAEQRDIARELLSSLGYKVCMVDCGREAVEYLKSHGADIVLLDMIMEKDFDGLETYREILKIKPGQKALIVSGFSATERVNEAVELGAGQYIKKPYTLRQLGLAIRKELDKENAPA